MINWIIILIVLLATLIITFVCIYFTQLQTISTNVINYCTNKREI